MKGKTEGRNKNKIDAIRENSRKAITTIRLFTIMYKTREPINVEAEFMRICGKYYV